MKVLIVSLYFPPAGGGGVQRTLKTATHLPGLGIDLRSERPKPAAIRKAVHRLLRDPRYAATVAALRAELEAYDPTAIIEDALTTRGHDQPVVGSPQS